MTLVLSAIAFVSSIAIISFIFGLEKALPVIVAYHFTALLYFILFIGLFFLLIKTVGMTAKVTVTLCPAVMTTSLAKMGGSVPVPALGGLRAMLFETNWVLAGSVSETVTPVAYP